MALVRFTGWLNQK